MKISDEEIKRILQQEHDFEFEGPLHESAPYPRINAGSDEDIQNKGVSD